jgi:hypothetical protein
MLGKLSGKGWTPVRPPSPRDENSVVGRYNGEPIKAGFRTDVIEDTDSVMHTKYRSGQYDLEVKIDFEIGRGQVRVSEAKGYEN